MANSDKAASKADKPHDDYGPAFAAAIWILTILAAWFLGLRMYAKRTRSRRTWWDDYFLIAAWVCVQKARG